MEIVFPRCAGLDVHKDTIHVCTRLAEPDGSVSEAIRCYGTTTRELQRLAEWLAEAAVSHVAMESTGVYWQPVYNIFEGRFAVLLCNAQHIKRVPGRKTDVQDCQWLAQLLAHGLLSPSFIPEREQRELRDLTRQRVQFVKEHTAAANRIQKVLEDANIKLASVASDPLGVSGREMLQALIADGTTPEQMAQLARGRLRNKREALERALEGRVRAHHRFMLKMLLDHLVQIEALIGQLDEQIEAVISSAPLQAMAQEQAALPFTDAVALLDTIPGIDVRAAQCVLAEIGTDMTRFPSAAHLASWAGLAPGNNESAGKRKRAKTTKGNRWLRRVLSQAAWAATRTKDTSLQAQYRRLSRRRGSSRAIVAVAHSLLVIIYEMLSAREPYRELGGDYYETLAARRGGQRQVASLVRRLQAAGYAVTLEPADQGA